MSQGFPGGSVVKILLANERDAGLIPGSGRSLGGGLSNPLQYSCLKNPMDRGPWSLGHKGSKTTKRLSTHCTGEMIFLRPVEETELVDVLISHPSPSLLTPLHILGFVCITICPP